MVYLLTEDKGSGLQFWNFICNTLFYGRVEVLEWDKNPNNTKLMKYALNIEDTVNTYIIVLDNVVDSKSLESELDEFYMKLEEKNMSNILILDFICFEYCILSFTDFIDWVFEQFDIFKVKRKLELSCRDDLLSAMSLGESSNIKKFMDKHSSCINFEQLCAKLLFEITRNTGFEVTKGSLGECWYVSCCNYSKRDSSDVCGLDLVRLNSYEKALELFKKTGLESSFNSIGVSL